jgi:putative nucleotidyltransferase with HDIG domain
MEVEMKGIFFAPQQDQTANSSFLPQGIKLLARFADMEIMTQNMVKGATVWLSPADNSEAVEFFFVHKGSLSINMNGEIKILHAGDYFYILELSEDTPCTVLEDTVLVYVSNTTMFDDAQDFERYINELIYQINEKDHYTYQHSANVMRYSKKLYMKLHEGAQKNDAVLNDMIVAALFHDVGKCYVPDYILKKKTALSPDEFRCIRHHPIDSARLLRKHYSKRVAEIAAHHHERIDGSGYPYGLMGDEISSEAKILAVADAFDAMTTDRGYNRVKSFEKAAEELYELPEHFDNEITTALLELVKSGALQPMEI